MNYYKVWVADIGYHKPEPLVYESHKPLKAGQLVEVPLKNKIVLGWVDAASNKPVFTAKELKRSFDFFLPQAQQKLFVWLLRYYPAPSGQIAQLFLPRQLPQKVQHYKTEPAEISPKTKPPLTQEQLAALDSIRRSKEHTILLHGDTGTGKTRVYLELCHQAVKQNKSAIVLTPEIGLTPQLAATFRAEFGEQVVIHHSHLSEAQRRQLWLRAANSQKPLVIIGPRSALFLPLHDPGVIIIDEAHDGSYKQEQAPHYQTTRVAAKLAQLSGSKTILGTATPLVADYYYLSRHNQPIIRMQAPAKKAVKAPRIQIIERTDKTAFSRSWLFSSRLIEAMESAKQNGKISLIFLNRRGTARLVLCQSCSWQANCPNCDLPLTYHGDHHQLRCHTCGFADKTPVSCPNCGSPDLSFQAAGTKALNDEIARLLPHHRLLRIDSDTEADTRLEQQYDNILNGQFDVIIGTQMVTKGLDLPNLAVVGIPFADSSLYLPDYTADEQTFQLLTQVVGRVGRTDSPTEVIVQTYQPDQPAIRAALKKDWATFYQNQLQERRQFAYPPFRYLLQLTASRKQEAGLRNAGSKLVEQIRRSWPEVTVLGPSPRFHRRVRGTHQWQVIVKAQNRQDLLEIVKELPAGWRHNLDPRTLL